MDPPKGILELKVWNLGAYVTRSGANPAGLQVCDATGYRFGAGGRQFARVTISAMVTTGHLSREVSSGQDAWAWKQTLVKELPAAPCGVE